MAWQIRMVPGIAHILQLIPVGIAASMDRSSGDRPFLRRIFTGCISMQEEAGIMWLFGIDKSSLFLNRHASKKKIEEASLRGFDRELDKNWIQNRERHRI